MQPTVSISFARHLSLRHARWENALASHEGVSPDGLPQIDGFQLERRIGQGRLACTFLARDLERGGRVVLKLLRRDLSASPARIAAFEREYAMLAALHHPHVVRVFGHSVMEGRPYLAMEYLGGGDLAGLLRSGLLPQEAVALLRQAGEAVAQLHRDGIVHCDVKPANLLLRHSGDLVLADFGAARRIGAPAPAGQIVGTPSHAAPELAQGGAASAAADIYSLGVVFHEMLCGRLPFPGRTLMEVVCQHLMAPIPRLPQPLALLQPLIDAMLDKQADRRLADGQALLARIDLLDGAPAPTQALAGAIDIR
jgi:serine/threonine-protein kinase PpkA